MTHDGMILENFVSYNSNDWVFVGNGHSLTISKTSSISQLVFHQSFKLSHVLFVLDMTKNLISISLWHKIITIVLNVLLFRI